jgi:probable rRNA maturation factor
VRAHYLPPWRVDVDWRPGVAKVVPESSIARSVGSALESAGAPGPASVGVILADDRELAELNAVHMGHEGPTDVLSFPLLPPIAYPAHDGQDPAVRAATAGLPFALPPGRRIHLGDIVVSVERAIEQAESGRGGQTSDVAWSPARELQLLVTHGTLHLCGWDHVRPDEEAAMRALERRLLEAGSSS